jgi:S-DNA-T family DNA segregation ATPase FtsK/SpoIIIE
MSGDRSEGQLLPKVYAEPMIAGRGRLVRRGERPTLVQVAHFTPTEALDAAGDEAPATASTPVLDADDRASAGSPAPTGPIAAPEPPEEAGDGDDSTRVTAGEPLRRRRRRVDGE